MEKAIETLNLKHEGLNVLINAYYEMESIEGDFDFGDESENADYLARFKSGELIAVCIVVSIFDKSGNLEGTDSLGMCHINSSDVLNEVQEIVKDNAMVETAFDDLKTVISLVKLLND